jgi:hypothetical protein
MEPYICCYTRPRRCFFFSRIHDGPWYDVNNNHGGFTWPGLTLFGPANSYYWATTVNPQGQRRPSYYPFGPASFGRPCYGGRFLYSPRMRGLSRPIWTERFNRRNIGLVRPRLLRAEPPQPRVASPEPPAQAPPARPRRGRPPLAGAGRAARRTPRAGRGPSRPVVIPLLPSSRATAEEPAPAPIEVPDERPYTPSGAPYTPSRSSDTPPGSCTSPEPDESQNGAEASAMARALEVVQKSDGSQGLKVTFRAVPVIREPNN